MRLRLNRYSRKTKYWSKKLRIKGDENMTVYAWLQPVDRIWKVITDPEKGTMYVYNEKNELI